MFTLKNGWDEWRSRESGAVELSSIYSMHYAGTIVRLLLHDLRSLSTRGVTRSENQLGSNLTFHIN